MLQALLHHKLKQAFSDSTFHHSEDTLTSSIFGLIQYLQEEDVYQILQKACGENTSFPQDIGNIISFQFWPHLSANDTKNSFIVEPDVLIETSNYVIIVEAKKYDGCGQYETQWENEIKSVLNDYGNQQNVFLIAMGGNKSLTNRVIKVANISYPIYTASWFNLLFTVSKMQSKTTGAKRRILSDVIRAFAKHGYMSVQWMNTLLSVSFSNTNIAHSWAFDHHIIIGNFNPTNIHINHKNFNVWKTTW